MPTTVSKNDSGWVWSSSTRCVYGATSLKARTKASSSSGSPSTLIRSFIVSTCGLVKRPVRSSRARSSASIIREVDVLPLVPVRWTIRKERCGSPSSSRNASIRSSEGSRRVSGQRESRASSTSLKVSAARGTTVSSSGRADASLMSGPV